MNIIETIKKNYKNILIILFAVLYIGSCTSNCSNKNELRMNAAHISAQDELIENLSNDIDSLNNVINMKDVVIEQKQMNVESLERTAKRNIVNVVKIDTTRIKK